MNYKITPPSPPRFLAGEGRGEDMKTRFRNHRRFPWLIIILGFLSLAIFSAGLYHLRISREQDIEKDQQENSTTSLAACQELSDFSSQEIKIKNLPDNSEIGAATRGVEEKIFYHTIKVSLPAIDREKEFYEGWLVRQAPYDFFSTGEMVTNELGEFILEWAGTHDDIISYNKIIITREVKDSDPIPGEQVATGSWE